MRKEYHIQGKDFWTEAARFLNKEMNEDESRAFQEWLGSHEKERMEVDRLREQWRKVGMKYSTESYETDKAWDKLYHRLGSDGLISGTQEKGSIPLWPIRQVLRVAAVVLVVIGLGWGGMFLWRQVNSGKMLEQISYADPSVEPINLPDGSKIYLNRGSRLLYPAKFDRKERKVVLEGEAYFEIKSNPKAPFRIDAGEAMVEVLGTTFNVISGTREKDVEVFVTTGKVAVERKNDGETLFLTPGEKAIVNRDLCSKSRNTNPNYLAWKSRKLVYDETPLSVVAKDLERSLGIHLEFEEEEMGELKLNSTFEDISEETIVLLISTTFNLNYSGSDKEYLLTR